MSIFSPRMLAFIFSKLFLKTRLLFPLIFLIFITSCDWMGKAPPPPLPGERIPVLVYDYSLKKDEAIASLPMTLPQEEENKDWPQTGNTPSHLIPPLAFPSTFEEVWSRSIGSGSSRRNRLLVEPIVAEDHVFTMDTSYLVSCFSLQDGDKLWNIDVSAADLKGASLGGGLAYEKGTLYVTTAIGEIIALDASSGSEKWRTSVLYPLRAAPTVADGKIFIITLNNTIEALDAQSGEKLWSHAGTIETAGVLGAASPAYSSETIIVPLMSGEIVALNTETGEVKWSDSLISMRKADGLTGLAHIRARPVIDGDVVYALSHSGRMVALDLTTGDRLWDKDIGGLYAPFIAGDFLFILTLEGDLVCLLKTTGQIKWVQNLTSALKASQEKDHPEEAEDSSSKKEEMHWVGPLIGGGNILIVGSKALLLKIDPQTQELKEIFPLKDKVLIPPIIAQKTLLVITDEGSLVAYR